MSSYTQKFVWESSGSGTLTGSRGPLALPYNSPWSSVLWYVVCRAAEAGEYGLEIWVSDAGVDSSPFYQVCQYLIVCAEVVGDGGAPRLPDVPPGFLGAQPDFRKFGIECASHEDPYIVASSGELKVSRRSLQVAVEQESCAIAKMTARCADKSKQTATPPPKIT